MFKKKACIRFRFKEWTITEQRATTMEERLNGATEDAEEENEKKNEEETKEEPTTSTLWGTSRGPLSTSVRA